MIMLRRRCTAFLVILALLFTMAPGLMEEAWDDTVTEGYVLLKTGDSGRAVRALQQALAELGFYAGEADGHFDDETLSAVKAYQGRNGLTVTGSADTETQRRIYETASRGSKGKSLRVSTVAPIVNASVKMGSTGDAVADLQDQLRELGFYQGKIDGICGRQTVNAIKAFQKAQGLYADGVAGANTLSWIRSRLGGGEAPEVTAAPTAVPAQETEETAATTEAPADSEPSPETAKEEQAEAETETGERQEITSPPAVLRSGSSGDGVVRLKTILYELGYDPGSMSNVYDAATKAAVKRFQKDAGLDSDGAAGPLTQKALLSAYAVLLSQGKDLVAWARSMAAESGAVCGTVMLTKNGEPFLTWSFGGVDETTCFRIASVTKWVTAIGLMTLYDRGLLDLDADIGTYLPFEVRNPAWPETKITARMLLTHTSSLSPEALDYKPDWSRIGKNDYDPIFMEDVCPGTRYTYADFDGALYGALIEAITGESVQNYLDRTVFTPLGLTAAYTPALLPEGTKTQSLLSPEGKTQISVQRDIDRGYNNQADPAGNLGYTVGRLYINAESLTALARMMLGGGELDGVRILKESTAALMEADQENLAESPYGLSTVRLRTYPRGVWYGHQGRYSGLTSNVYYQRETGITMVLILDGYAYELEDNVVLPAASVLRGMETLESLVAE